MDNKQSSDHDILIKVATSIDVLCKKVDKVDENNKQEHKDIRNMIDDNYKLSAADDLKQLATTAKQVETCNSKFLQTKVFLWVLGFVIVGVIGAYSFTSIVQADLSKHKLSLERHRIQEDKVMDMILEKFKIKGVVTNESSLSIEDEDE